MYGFDKVSCDLGIRRCWIQLPAPSKGGALHGNPLPGEKNTIPLGFKDGTPLKVPINEEFAVDLLAVNFFW